MFYILRLEKTATSHKLKNLGVDNSRYQKLNRLRQESTMLLRLFVKILMLLYH